MSNMNDTLDDASDLKMEWRLRIEGVLGEYTPLEHGRKTADVFFPCIFWRKWRWFAA